MKIAILADIHANLVGLQTVIAHLRQWQPNVVIVAGDVVNRGPRPAECLRLVQTMQQTAGWRLVRGNHEDYVLGHAQPNAPRHGPRFAVHQHSYWTFRQLNGHIAALEAMPFQHSLPGPDGGEVRITHASMRGIRDGIYPETTEADLRRKIDPAPTVLCVGHTHRPLVRMVDDTLVVNAGSVGLPFDGDPRPAYAQLLWRPSGWQAEIVRLAYDHQQAEQDFFETDFMEGSGPLGELILDEFRVARSRLYQWTNTYQARVLAGQMSVARSVREYMAALAH
jgi:predicted phosphodiesterase